MAWWYASLLLGGCSIGGLFCDVAAEAVDIAGPGALDCQDDLHCAADALAAGTPFAATWDLQGGDSVIHRAAASDGVTTWLLFQDGAGEVGAVECLGATFDGADTGATASGLGCDATVPEGNHYRVCGRDAGQRPEPLPFPP